MARVLILSSSVACGHVGLSAGMPVLQILGHEVIGLPTVILSNHPGFQQVAGQRVDPAQVLAMVNALEGNGWLTGLDAVQIGYLPSAEHVGLAVDLIARLRAGNRALRVVVDPVLGDDPGGLYIAQTAAEASRDRLVPLADVLTPNRFEAAWLGFQDDPRVLLTSAEAGPDRIGVRVSGRLYAMQRQRGVPQGTGDVFAALIAAGLSVGQALGHLDALIRHSLNQPHLQIAQSAPHWTKAPPVTGAPHGL